MTAHKLAPRQLLNNNVLHPALRPAFHGHQQLGWVYVCAFFFSLVAPLVRMARASAPSSPGRWPARADEKVSYLHRLQNGDPSIVRLHVARQLSHESVVNLLRCSDRLPPPPSPVPPRAGLSVDGRARRVRPTVTDLAAQRRVAQHRRHCL